MSDIAEKAKRLPSPKGRVVTVKLELVPAFIQLHNLKPFSWTYVVGAMDHVLICKQRESDDETK